MSEKKRVLDVACGSKMFWFDKNNPDVEYCDKRTVEYHEFYPKRYIEICVLRKNTIWITERRLCPSGICFVCAIADVTAAASASVVWSGYDAVASCKYDSHYNPPDEGDKTIDREVLKVWEDDGNENKRPDEIVVQLLRDGEVYDTEVLNEGNNWRYTWTGLADDYTWRVVEYQTPDGYTVTVHREGITFVMTNTYDTPPDNPPETPPPDNPPNTPPDTPPDNPPDTPPDNPPGTPPDEPGLPQTGVLWWPVPLLAGGGLLLFFLGWARRRHGEQDP